MTVTLYKNNSEQNKLDKTLQTVATVSGTMRDPADITTPAVTIQGAAGLLESNYAYIPELGRYYYIDRVRAINTALYEFTMRVDVLMTYRDKIRQQSAIIARNANKYNTLINDGTLHVQSGEKVFTRTFPRGFGDTYTNVLVMLGGVDVT